MECCKTHATVVLCVQTGKLWSGLKDYETAEGCYAKAMEYAQFLLDVSNNLDKTQIQREECAVELFGLYLDRTVAAWQLQQKVIHGTAQAQVLRCIVGPGMLPTAALHLQCCACSA